MRILALLLFVIHGWAQQTTPAVAKAPDCIRQVVITAALGTSGNFDNRQVGCANWVVAYQSTGFSVVSLTFESAPTGTDTTPGTFVTFAGSIVSTADASNINPNTAITQAFTVFSGFYPWVRVKLSSATGSGTIRGILYGYKAH